MQWQYMLHAANKANKTGTVSYMLSASYTYHVHGASSRGVAKFLIPVSFIFFSPTGVD